MRDQAYGVMQSLAAWQTELRAQTFTVLRESQLFETRKQQNIANQIAHAELMRKAEEKIAQYVVAEPSVQLLHALSQHHAKSSRQLPASVREHIVAGIETRQQQLQPLTSSFFSHDLFTALTMATRHQQRRCADLLVQYFSVNPGHHLLFLAAHYVELIKRAIREAGGETQQVSNSITSYLYQRLSDWYPSENSSRSDIQRHFIKSRNEFVTGLVKACLQKQHEPSQYIAGLSETDIEKLMAIYKLTLATSKCSAQSV